MVIEKFKKAVVILIMATMISPALAMAEEYVPPTPMVEQTAPVTTTETPVTNTPVEVTGEETVAPSIQENTVTQDEPAVQTEQPVEGTEIAPVVAPEQKPEEEKNVEEKETSETKVDQNAEVENKVEAEANTGGNEASMNSDDTSIQTGDANSFLSIINLLNSNFVTGPDGKVLFIYKNYFQDLIGDYLLDPLTGESYDLNGSRVEGPVNAISADAINNLIINNNGKLDNDVTVTSNTGDNTANFNSGDGNISTGDANISLNVLNFVNSNFLATDGGLLAVVNVFGDWIGNLLLPKSLISSTGVSATNNMAIGNEADIQNNLDLNLNTGDNEANYNSENANITTGDALAKLNLNNIANKTLVGDVVYLAFVNVLGDWEGQDLTKTSLGATLSSLGNLVTDSYAKINNNFHLFVNTGGNEASYNSGSGNISTGDANISANLVNFANLNVVSGKFVILLVNVFGDWKGNIEFEKEATAPVITEDPQTIIVVPTRVINYVKKSIKLPKLSGFNSENNIEEPQGDQQVAAAEYVPEYPNWYNDPEQTAPQTLADFVDLSYRYLAASFIITLIVFGIVYRKIRQNRF
jgi:hypothetical protein